MNVIACAADTKYLKRYGIPFLESIYQTNPDLAVHIVLVDVDDEAIAAAANPNVTVTNVTRNLSTKPEHQAYLKEHQTGKYVNAGEAHDFYSRPGPENILQRVRMYSDLSLFCIYSKYYCAKMLLERYDKVLLLDVDALVKRDLSELFDIADTCDIATRQDVPVNGEYRIFNEGVVVVKSNDRTKTFMRDIMSYYTQNGLDKHNFQADQMFFREEYYEQNIGIHFHDLDGKYKDEEFRDDSVIWSGCGDRKRELHK